MLKKLLIAGGGYTEIPLVKEAQKMGYYVITSGNNSLGAAHSYSNKYIAVDFSDKEALLQVAKRENISAICACSHDFSAISSAYVAERLGLPGHDSYSIAILIHHKDKFRDFCATHKLSVPKAKGFSTIQEATSNANEISFPRIIKPIDLCGGSGISIAQNDEEYWTAIAIAFEKSQAKKIVVEEFIEGTYHGFSCFIEKGKVVYYFSDDEYYRPYEFLVAGTSTPSSLVSSEINQLITFTEQTASLLDLCDGLFHVQCVVKNNKVYIIEVCRRIPGDLYSKFVEYATGVNFNNVLLHYIGNEIPNYDSYTIKNKYIARHCIMAESTGILKELIITQELQKYVFDEYKIWKPNIDIQNIQSQKLTILFMKFPDRNTIKKISANLYDYIRYE